VKFWTLLNWISGIGVIALLGAVLFAPLPLLSKYGMRLLLMIIALGVLSMLHSAYVFVKEIPKRKWGDQKKEYEPVLLGVKRKTWKSIGEWGFMILVLIILWQYQRGGIGSKECPDLVRGNEESSSIVQYFYSPFCPACWKGEKIMQNLIKKYPNVRFENLDSRYCKNDMREAGVRRSPAYNLKNAAESKVVYGIDGGDIERNLCDLGGC